MSGMAEIKPQKLVRLQDPKAMNVDGVSTSYHMAGRGEETIVLMYGGNFGMIDPALSAYEWRCNFESLSKRHRMVAFDKLGQGYTGAPLRDEDYVMRAVTQHAARTIELLELGPVHLVGHSRGGLPAVRIAMERPDLVRSLTIVSSSTLAPGVGLNEVTMAMPPHPQGTREAARWACEACSAKPEAVTEDWVDAAMQVLQQPSYQEGIQKMGPGQLAVQQFIPDLARYKRETLSMLSEGRLQRPTQIVWGANDPTAILDRGLRLFELVAAHERRASLNVFNNAGHFPFAEHPARFNAMLTAFVELHRREGQS